MKPERINQLIAEHCGWKSTDQEKLWFLAPNGLNVPRHSLPQYHSDLNAMHEAEGIIGDARLVGEYWDQIDINGEKLARLDEQMTGARLWAILHATARQRAEAFLRTLGLWEE